MTNILATQIGTDSARAIGVQDGLEMLLYKLYNLKSVLKYKIKINRYQDLDWYNEHVGLNTVDDHEPKHIYTLKLIITLGITSPRFEVYERIRKVCGALKVRFIKNSFDTLEIIVKEWKEGLGVENDD